METTESGNVLRGLPPGAPRLGIKVPRDGRVLLHACCAPCSTAILECLVSNGIRPVVFFSNSNIVPADEYLVRKAELERYCALLGISMVDDDYDHSGWLDFALERSGGDKSRSEALAKMPERGERCLNCFKYRLLRAARYAARNGFSLLATTLASSRWKNLDQVDAAGLWACAAVNAEDGATQVCWWGMNWRKGGLQPRRSELIRSLGLYNQTRCGCEFNIHTMSQEIERKFLVRNAGFKEEACSSVRITQGYLNSDPERTVRVRVKGDRGYITVKGKTSASGVSRFEWEMEIGAEEARKLLELALPGVIDKTRYIVRDSDGVHNWEVDEFHAENEGLVIAEIELADENESFGKPSWLGGEVTGDPRFFNSMLSKNPYGNW